jgi:hypothetical protein
MFWVVRAVESDEGVRSLEVSGCCQLGYVDLLVHKLLLVFGGVSLRPTEDHEAASRLWEVVVVLLLGVVL